MWLRFLALVILLVCHLGFLRRVFDGFEDPHLDLGNLMHEFFPTLSSTLPRLMLCEHYFEVTLMMGKS